MKLVNPWDNIEIKLLRNGTLQHFDNNIHLIFVSIGDVSVKVDDRYLLLQAGDYLIIPKGSQCQFTFQKAKAFYMNLHYIFPLNTRNDEFEYEFVGDSVENPQAEDNELIKAISKLLQLYVLKNNNQNAFVFQHYFEIIGKLEKHYRKKIKIDQKRNTRKKIEELRFYIDNNFEKNIKLSDLAQQLFISEQYLSRLFSEGIGMPLSDYLIKCRLQKVRNELLETEKSITDIAFAAGFTNMNSFNRIFKKSQGMTPTEYRREGKQSNQITSNLPKKEIDENNVILDFFPLQEVQEEKSKIIEVSDKTSKKEFSLDLLINLGYAEDFLFYPLANQLKDFQQDVNLKYGRLWGILSQKIIGKDINNLNFSKTDQILDLLIANNLIPFLEIGFKGKIINLSFTNLAENIPYEKRNTLEEELEVLIRFLKHCIRRYGIKEVSTWVLEVWRPSSLVMKIIEKPNLMKIFFEERELNLLNDKDYFVYFSEISRISKNLLPQIQIGGCGISPNIEKSSFKNFFTQWKSEEMAPDFLSFSIFPFDEIKNQDYDKEVSALISPNAQYMLSKIKEVKNTIEEMKWNVPIYITEFNITVVNRDLINDTSFKGPYILRNILDVSSHCNIIGYWLLSDYSTVGADCNQLESFGGAGIMSKHGISKIGYYALKFLKKMRGDILQQDKELLITKTQEKLQILIFNYSHLSSSYYYNQEGSYRKENIYFIFKEEKTKKVKFKIAREIFPKTQIVHIDSHKIGKKYGSFFEEVNRLNQVNNLTVDEVKYLKGICVPQRSAENIKLNHDYFEVNMEVEAHDILFLEISQIN